MGRLLSRRRVLELAGGTVAGIGLSGTAAADPGGHSRSQGRVSFSEPVRLNPPQRYGYEPSVSVDPFGNIYATAHKSSVTNEGRQLSSFFWYSADGGETFLDMPSPANVDDKLYAFEGDIAVDAEGMVYYCDTYLVENTFSRWKTAPSGPIYDLSKPFQQTTGIDDRPWLRAHGDGVVYYLGNNGVAPPAPDNPQDGGARIWFYRSTDGGLTWSLGYGFPNSGYCSLAENKADDHTVYVAGDFDDADSGPLFKIFESHNQGRSFENVYQEQFRTQAADPFGVWSVTDRVGNPYHVWIDDDVTDDEPAIVNFTRCDGSGGWETLDITPFAGTLNKPWIAAGSEGFVAVTFYGSEEVQVGDSTDWFPYALVTTNALSSNPNWTLVRLTDIPVATDSGEPEDFFEVAIGPFDRIHVTYAREVTPGTVFNPTRTYLNNLFYIQGSVQGLTTEPPS